MPALDLFRPTMWSDQLIVDVEKSLVFRNVANTDYQGEITAAGNVVKINEIGDVTVNSYTENSSLTYQTLNDAQRELVIDQKKYFAFLVDDVATAQANVNIMSAAMTKAGHAIADTVDRYLAGLYGQAGVSDTNLGSSSTSQTIYAEGNGSDGVIGAFTTMHKALDESNAPSMDRWAVIPAWMHSYLIYAGFVADVSPNLKAGNNTGAMGNGFVGNVMGFNVYASNNVDNNGTQYRVMFGTRDALSFAGQVTKVESGRHSDYMADFVRGLYVYGAKVVRPDHLGTAYLAAGGLST